MPRITSTQHREPYSHSAASYSEYNHTVEATEFNVKKQSFGDQIQFRVFFPRSGTPSQGVGLTLPSAEITVALGRALLTVAEGYLSEMTAKF